MIVMFVLDYGNFFFFYLLVFIFVIIDINFCNGFIYLKKSLNILWVGIYLVFSDIVCMGDIINLNNIF